MKKVKALIVTDDELMAAFEQGLDEINAERRKEIKERLEQLEKRVARLARKKPR
jgi:tetrahydromethanopterin S-methyltransferase subunit G